MASLQVFYRGDLLEQRSLVLLDSQAMIWMGATASSWSSQGPHKKHLENSEMTSATGAWAYVCVLRTPAELLECPRKHEKLTRFEHRPNWGHLVDHHPDR